MDESILECPRCGALTACHVSAWYSKSAGVFVLVVACLDCSAQFMLDIDPTVPEVSHGSRWPLKGWQKYEPKEGKDAATAS